jgi:alpha-1,6-mannosyltransferase
VREELAQGADLLLVHCGRLSPEKEPQRSIETLVELQNRGINARLIIIGTGPMWKKMRLLAKGLPIDMLGYIADRKRVASILASADFALAPGPLETFCLSALESISSGTPVVASQSSAVGEFLRLSEKDPAGAVAADDGKSFADQIEQMIGCSLMRKSARESAESLPWEKTIQLMLQLHGIDGVQNHALVDVKVELKVA